MRIEYLRPSQAGDALSVITSAEQRTQRGLRVWQEIVRGQDGSPCVRARSRYLTARD
jgi:hypothetical protein